MKFIEQIDEVWPLACAREDAPGAGDGKEESGKGESAKGAKKARSKPGKAGK